MRGLFNKLKNNIDLLNSYDDIINEQLQLNIIEHASIKDENNTVHYLPHRPVIRPDKITSKVRNCLRRKCENKWTVIE